MARIRKTPDNLFPMPTGAYLVGKGYVCVNTGSKYISADQRKTDGKGYTGHTGECIGVLENPEDKKCRMFYANDKYRSSHNPDELPDPPEIADSVAVGLLAVVRTCSIDAGLADDLTEAFDSEDAALVLDLAFYMMSKESAVMQHFPAWARDHAHFSETIRSDTYLGVFLKEHLSIPKINVFRRLWLRRNIGKGYVCLCYDSTNVNSQAEGVSIVQKGRAKDDPTLEQLNTDSCLRQEDGMPLTCLHSPGSITDIAQAQEIINTIEHERAELEAFLAKGESYKRKNLKGKFPAYFRRRLAPGEPKTVIQHKRGRGVGIKEVQKPTVIVTGFEDDEAMINRWKLASLSWCPATG